MSIASLDFDSTSLLSQLVQIISSIIYHCYRQFRNKLINNLHIFYCSKSLYSVHNSPNRTKGPSIDPMMDILIDVKPEFDMNDYCCIVQLRWRTAKYLPYDRESPVTKANQGLTPEMTS